MRIFRIFLITIGLCCAVIGALGVWAETSPNATGTLAWPLFNLIGGLIVAGGAWKLVGRKKP